MKAYCAECGVRLILKTGGRRMMAYVKIACGCCVPSHRARVTCGKPEHQRKRKTELQRERRERCRKFPQWEKLAASHVGRPI